LLYPGATGMDSEGGRRAALREGYFSCVPGACKHASLQATSVRVISAGEQDRVVQADVISDLFGRVERWRILGASEDCRQRCPQCLRLLLLASAICRPLFIATHFPEKTTSLAEGESAKS
jgi:hypothetical protein